MRPLELVRDIGCEGVSGASSQTPMIDEIDALRSRHYDLLAAILGRTPSQEILDQLAGLRGDASPLGQACTALAAAAADARVHAVEREFFDLFVGVGRGELVPFASYYLTGFLNERPLARVRDDLARLGLESTGGMSEPEDHIAMLLEAMAGLASGRFEAEPGVDRAFFERHLKPWAARFFADVEGAKAARFYRAVGGLGRAFMDIEAEAYALDA
ncbi:Chaperone protein TorD [Methylobacterium iners]|uniref:Chaperone protein TorD n=2 Tax=Methylobacterium iners TaxID=418707 RepID=A0ABQ4RVU2_9HYPH|nr:Chaperone protein TorD [Methylobacterium iners]